MLKSNGSKNSDEFLDNLKRKVNTQLDKEEGKENTIQQRKQKLLDNNNMLEWYFLDRFNSLCTKRGIMTGKRANEILGISAPTFSAYKNGDKFPTLHTIEMLAEKLNTSSGYLLGYTDNPSPILNKINMIQGLTEEARYNIYKFAHNIKDDGGDFKTDLPYLDLPYYEDNTELLEMLSLFISDFSNFCYFLTYIKKYVTLKQEIDELRTDEKSPNIRKIKKLDDELLRN